MAGITTLEAANQYLRDVYLPQPNGTFQRAARDLTNGFLPLGSIDLDRILCYEATRIVAPDNTVALGGHVLQIARQPGRRTCAGLHILVRQHLDGVITLTRPPDVCLGRFTLPLGLEDTEPVVEARHQLPHTRDLRRTVGPMKTGQIACQT